MPAPVTTARITRVRNHPNLDPLLSAELTNKGQNISQEIIDDKFAFGFT
jgi:hypothetical protein